MRLTRAKKKPVDHPHIKIRKGFHRTKHSPFRRQHQVAVPRSSSTLRRSSEGRLQVGHCGILRAERGADLLETAQRIERVEAFAFIRPAGFD